MLNEENLFWEPHVPDASVIYDYSFLKDELLRLGREDFSATIQKFLEDSVVEYLNLVYKKYGIKRICF